MTATIGILPIACTNENGIVPSAVHRLVVPPGNTIHDLILSMDKETFVNLYIRIWRHAKIMAVLIAVYAVEKASQVVDAANTHFQRIEDTIADLRGKREIEVITRNSEAEIATIDDLPLQIGDIGNDLRRCFSSEAHQHKAQ